MNPHGLPIHLAVVAASLLVAPPAGFAGPPAGAAEGQPSTRPATGPAPDTSTPKGALKALLIAAEAGNAKAVAAAFCVEQPINKPVAAAGAEALCAYVRCMNAAAARFQPEWRPRPQESVPGMPADLDAAPVRMDGTDRATVEDKKWSIVNMRREGGVWKLAYEGTLGGFSPGQEADAAREAMKLHALARSLNRLADEVPKGKHPTPEAVQEEMGRLRKQADEAAGHPATQPSA